MQIILTMVSIPQAVSAVATSMTLGDFFEEVHRVSIPQAVSAVATTIAVENELNPDFYEFQYRKR